MLFSSPVFLFLFLPVTLLAHILAPRVAKNFVLLVASLLFYAWGEVRYVGLMLLVIGLNYVFGLLAEKARDQRRGIWLLAAAVIANLAILAYYKYANFAIDNYNALLARFAIAPIDHREIILPIGISFYTFQALSYVIDVYRGDTRAQRNPLDLALYVSLFPQLIAGPIVRYVDVAVELRDRRTDWNRFADGAQRFCIGLAKKMLLANSVAVVADAIFDVPNGELPTTTAWLGIICYALQIYFDFSGYSEMAIGLGRMLGFAFFENFNYPYIAQSLTDFWRRWHISLSTWFRDYLYIPMGGNRLSPQRTAFNLLVVFFLCGLWHGASWTFVVWGLYHGVVLSAERFGLAKFLQRLPRILRHVYLLNVVLVGWVLFRADDLPHAAAYLQSLAGWSGATTDEFSVQTYLDSGLALCLLVGTAACCPVAPTFENMRKRAAAFIRHSSRSDLALDLLWGLCRIGAVSLLLVTSAAMMLNATYNPFIYFRF